MRRLLPAGLAVLVVLAGCSPTPQQRQPVAADDGIQLTGRIDDRRVSLSDGAPQVVLGDCDPNQGRDTDLCAVTRTIDGERLAVVIENPDVLAPDTVVQVLDDACAEAACDVLRDGVVVDVRLGDLVLRATGGTVTVVEAGPRRFRGELLLQLPPNGRLTGTFNLDTLAPSDP